MDSSQSEIRQRKVQKKEEEDSEPALNQKELSPEDEKKKKNRSIWTRVLVAIPMVVVFTAILLSDHVVVALFVILLQIIIFKELVSLKYREAKEKNLWGFRTLHWVFLLTTFFFLYGDMFLQHAKRFIPFKTLEYLHRYHLAISYTLYVSAFTAFIAKLKKGLYKYQLSQIAWTVMMLLVVVVQSHVILQNIFNGLIWFILPSTLIICNDTMAYVCGLAMGRRFIKRPLTSLSPNKTWEGFIGSLFCTIAFAFVASRFLSQYDWFICPKEIEHMFSPITCIHDPIFEGKDYLLPTEIISFLNYLGISKATVNIAPIQFHAVVFALFASLLAPFGGFFASAMKRAYGIKDFGSILPGHGGVTDRMDCQFPMGLFVFVYYKSFLSPSSLTVSQILFLLAQLSQEEQIKVYEQLGRFLGKA